MTEKQKRYAIIGIVIIIILLLLFWPKRLKAITGSDWQMPDISIPAFNLPPRTNYPINIPGLPPREPIEYPFSAVSACMCGSGTVPYYFEPVITSTPTQNNYSPYTYTYTTYGDYGGTRYNTGPILSGYRI